MAGVVVACVFLALMFVGTWRAMFGAAMVAAWLLRIVFIMLLGTAILCNGYTYQALGWTPLSLMLGDQVYDQSMNIIEGKPRHAPRARKTN